jgi:hypothetical protein
VRPALLTPPFALVVLLLPREARESVRCGGGTRLPTAAALLLLLLLLLPAVAAATRPFGVGARMEGGVLALFRLSAPWGAAAATAATAETRRCSAALCGATTAAVTDLLLPPRIAVVVINDLA